MTLGVSSYTHTGGGPLPNAVFDPRRTLHKRDEPESFMFTAGGRRELGRRGARASEGPGQP